jgi:hypothetical protein
MAEPIPNPINLSRRRLCNPLGRNLGCTADCCAVSAARARAALTAAIPRSSRALARPASFGAAKSCSLVIFIIRPPTSPGQNNTHDRGLLMTLLNRTLTRPLRTPLTITPSRHRSIGLTLLRHGEQPPVFVV